MCVMMFSCEMWRNQQISQEFFEKLQKMKCLLMKLRNCQNYDIRFGCEKETARKMLKSNEICCWKTENEQGFCQEEFYGSFLFLFTRDRIFLSHLLLL